MDSKPQSQDSIFGISWNSILALLIVLLVLIVVILFIVFTDQPAQGQTFQVIYGFTGGADGTYPQAGLTMDRAGNLYGAAASGGYTGSPCGLDGCGTIFKLSKRNSGWLFATLYEFHGGDGLQPSGRPALAQDGTLYGVTYLGGPGGCQGGCGTVYHLTPAPRPPLTVLAPWDETAIHYFTIDDGAYLRGDITFDLAGNIYVTALRGGPSDDGVVYQLTPSNGSWVGTIIHSFNGQEDGEVPTGGVVFDRFGNIYGVTEQGGLHGVGTIYELSPSGSTWIERTLFNFSYQSGGVPVGGLIIDASGNLYGTTTAGGSNGAGMVFEFTPGGVMKILYNLPRLVGSGCIYSYLCGPLSKLVMDAAGNLYGTVVAGGAYGGGTVFRLSPGNNGWTYTSLHDFTGQSDSGGAFPDSTLIFDAAGNLYGTASEGGINNNGTVFEIAQ